MEDTATTDAENIIYVADEEQEHRSEWSYQATKELLKNYDEKTDMLDTGIISTYKKLWELTSKALAKKGFYYTPCQCENKWKALKRAYKNKLVKIERFGSCKRPCPFEYEIAEIISKRPNDSFSRNYSVRLNEMKKQEEFFKINLNEPPGFSKENNISIKTEPMNGYSVSSAEESQSNTDTEDKGVTYTIIEDNNTSQVVEGLSDLKRILVKHNKINGHLLKQTSDIQEQILSCLERTVEEQVEMRKLREKEIEQQEEMMQQMRLQNELLQKLLEKLG